MKVLSFSKREHNHYSNKPAHYILNLDDGRTAEIRADEVYIDYLETAQSVLDGSVKIQSVLDYVVYDKKKQLPK